jgi:hypothetical protein
VAKKAASKPENDLAAKRVIAERVIKAHGGNCGSNEIQADPEWKKKGFGKPGGRWVGTLKAELGFEVGSSAGTPRVRATSGGSAIERMRAVVSLAGSVEDLIELSAKAAKLTEEDRATMSKYDRAKAQKIAAQEMIEGLQPAIDAINAKLA